MKALSAILLPAGLILAALLCSLPATAAGARTPLLQPGKKSVYQRVLSHPGARLYAGPEADAQVKNDRVKTFTVFYIYGRQGERLEVGAGSSGADGWVDASMVTEWPQAITMLFTDRTGRAPVYFFRDRESLEKTCQADNVTDTIRQYAAAIEQKKQPADFPVVASEPADSAVAQKNFYLMPVLNIDSRYQGLNLVEVAAIDPGSGEGGNGAAVADRKATSAPAELRTGIAFVIDTTISMKPYIDQSLKLIRHLYDELEKSPYRDKMAFAVVAFRSNMERTPDIGYTAKIICDFTTVQDRARLEHALAQVQEATVSTHDVNEDAFAGIKEGVDKLSWKDYGGRVMLMISDAGPLGAGDPTSQTGLSPEALADYLRENRIYLTALHLKTPAAIQNHRYAAEAYRTLTMQSDNQASYIPLDASTPQQGTAGFHRTGQILAESYGKVVTATAEGRLLDTPRQESRKDLSPEDEARRIAESTGYAMQLQFLGDRSHAAAPQVVRAWLADADLARLENNGGAPILAVSPAVLLTKSQLSNLHKQLKLILQGSREAFLNGDDDLFGQIRSAAAQMSRDPAQFTLHPDRNLVENGLLDEVLNDLPYKSTVGALTQKSWEDMSTGERDAFNRRLEGLLARYEEYDRDATHWETFGAPNPEDWVYRVPLSMLP